MSKQRFYNDEPYLRSEHLLKGGKYNAVSVEIEDIVHDCPGKKGDKDKIMLGLAFKNATKILGLNKTNESLVCIEAGSGNPADWIGKKIMLVVRLIPNKRQKTEEPAIRIWPSCDHKKLRAQVRDNLGQPVPDSWYAKDVDKPQQVEGTK